MFKCHYCEKTYPLSQRELVDKDLESMCKDCFEEFVAILKGEKDE